MSYPIVIENRGQLAELAADVLEFGYEHVEDLDTLWEDAEILGDVFAVHYEDTDPRG